MAQAEAAFAEILASHPGHAGASLALARLALQRSDVARAEAVLEAAARACPDDEQLAVELAVARAGADRLEEAIDALRRHLAVRRASPLAWLLLGQMLTDRGDEKGSLLARYEAIAQARGAGLWPDAAHTPGHLVGWVGEAVGTLRRCKGDVLRGLIEPQRLAHGAAALSRVERMLRGYLGEEPVTPPDPSQRPRFLYMPDLPTSPFLDPDLQPWTPRLRAAFADIRDEAMAQLLDRAQLEDFVKVREGDRIGNYLGGREPAWEAFFFYRHGQRYDAHHARCPRTSAVLESLDLCRIPGQTPEICFSVLAAGTTILPHHGVTNTRSVMHLPLVVPPACALHLVGHGEHCWREGEPMLFDDSFLHEAWNRSDAPRVILLMDCWNPHLTAVEREAVTVLAQAIGVLDVALREVDWPQA